MTEAPGSPYPEASPPTPPPSRALAVWALVLALLGFCGVTALVALVLAIVALTRVRSGRAQGKGMAVAALVVSGAWMVVGTVVVVLLALLGNSLAGRDPDGHIVDAGRLALSDLRVGDCVEDVLEDSRLRTVVGVPCSEPHQHEVFGTFEFPEGPFPGQASVDEQSEARCFALLPPFIGGDSRGLQLVYLRPDESDWRGDREVICLVTTGTTRSGSLRGSG